MLQSESFGPRLTFVLRRLGWGFPLAWGLFLAVGGGLIGCGDELAEINRGGVSVSLRKNGRMVIRRNGTTVLEGNAGNLEGSTATDTLRTGDAYAPFGLSETIRRTVEEVYGYFRFNDRVDPFVRGKLKEIRESGSTLRFKIDGGGNGSVTLEADGSVVVDWQRSTPRVDDRLAMTFVCHDNERFFGLGAQVSAEHSGQRIVSWTSEQGNGKADRGESAIFGLTGEHYDTYTPVPFALSSRPMGFWLDTTYRNEMELCQDAGRLRFEVQGPRFVLHIFTGDTMAEVLGAYTAQTGRAQPVARWAFAPWVDTFGGPGAISAAIDLLRSRQIPASAVWSEDWVGTVDALGGEHLTYDWEEDPSRFPDLAGVADSLHRAGFRFLVYVNPFIPNDTNVYQDALTQGALIRDASGTVVQSGLPWGAPQTLFDPTANGGPELFADYMSRALAKGVDGWMHDYGEAVPYDAVLADGRIGAETHNAYPLMWATVAKDFWEQAGVGNDFAVFSRSGYTGISAVTYLHWFGDQLTSFDRNDGLGSVVPQYLSAGLSGISLAHSDIGGYTSVSSTRRTLELLGRWLSLEAFTPVFRTHHTSDPTNLQWHSNEDTLAVFEKYARWHQRLAPYFAMVATAAYEKGVPAVRPIWWGHEDQSELFGVTDQFLCGADLLVAPIVEEGATSRLVQLPPGMWRRWREWEGPLGAPIGPGGATEADAAWDEPVLWVRAGAAIPLLSTEYDSLAVPRDGVTTDPGVEVPPSSIDQLSFMLSSGGNGTGRLDHAGFAPAEWEWEGSAMDSGPLTGVSVSGGAALPSCQTEAESDCWTDSGVRLSGSFASSRSIVLSSANGTGIFSLSGAELTQVRLLLR